MSRCWVSYDNGVRYSVQRVHEERHPVLHPVQDFREEDHGGGVVRLTLDVDTPQSHVLIVDLLRRALDDRHCRELGPASHEEAGCGPSYVLLHLKIINPEPSIANRHLIYGK
jgi:hypothetical protein